jgi:tripartite-type tricarboxylate transporter receptor subunit TctC
VGQGVARAALVLALATSQVCAQPAYPNEPIRVIVPIAAGSVTDVIMRAASQELAARLLHRALVIAQIDKTLR